MVLFQILLDGAESCDAGTTQLSSPVCQRRGQQDSLGICVVVHAHNMPKHGKPAQLDYSSEFGQKKITIMQEESNIRTF